MSNFEYKVITVGSIGTNCILVKNSKTNRGFITDPGAEASTIIAAIKDFNLLPEAILNTHCHFDHILAINELKEKYKIPLIIHEAEEEYALDPNKNYSATTGTPTTVKADSLVKDAEEINIADLKIKVLHTPGHTLGSCCYYLENLLLSGDTLFYGSIGRYDLYGGDMKTILTSIKNKLFPLNDEAVVIPGHGSTTSIKQEKIQNPFFR